MKKNIFFCLCLLQFISSCVWGQVTSLGLQIDSLLKTNTSQPFNGVILISQNGNTIYSKAVGYSDLSTKTPLQLNDQFVIGSISKQVTAVLTLQELDKGHLQLNESIFTYLPYLKKFWPQDTITIQQLLSHTHGIAIYGKPLKFKPGTQYDYSQVGYEMLGRIITKTSNKPYYAAVEELFGKCKMTNSWHPDFKKHKLVKAYTKQENDSLVIETRSLENYPEAGSLISTAEDLAKWNTCLHEGSLLRKSTYEQMITKQKNAILNHPIFGQTTYGLGPTISTDGGIVQLGQSGFAPGFASFNFYLPEKKVSVIVLENVVYNPDDLKQTFYVHTAILDLVKKSFYTKH